MKKQSVIALVSAALTMTSLASCGNGQSSDGVPTDSANQMNIAELENATLLKQLDDCAFYLSSEENPDYGRVENNLIVKYTPSNHKFDTLFNSDILCN